MQIKAQAETVQLGEDDITILLCILKIEKYLTSCLGKEPRNYITNISLK